MLGSIRRIAKSLLNKSEFNARVELIKDIPLFQDLDADHMAEFAENLETRIYSPGVKILIQGKKVEGVSFLQEGEVQIVVASEHSGKEELIANGHPGECFGEMSSLRGETLASATVVTSTESRVLFMKKEGFIQLVEKFNLWPGFVRVLATRLDHTNRRMSEVMKHLKHGMVEVDSKGNITEKFSMEFVHLTGRDLEKVHRLSFAELILTKGSTAEKQWLDNLPLVFSSPIQQSRLILDLLPGKISFNHPAKGVRFYKISYDPCCTEGRVVGIDVGLEDVTRIEELAIKSRQLEGEKSVLQEIFSNPETFRTLLHLIESVKKHLRKIEQDVEENSISRDMLGSWMGLVHSLKGVSRFLHLDDLGDAAHSWESVLTVIEEKEALLPEDFENYTAGKKALDEAMKAVDKILEEMTEETRRRMTAEVILTKEEINSLESSAKKNTESLRLLQGMRKVSSRSLIEGWGEEIKNVCQDGKKRIRFKVKGSTITIPTDLFNSVQVSLMHLFRNSVDHGIETAMERTAEGKSPAGLIEFYALQTEEHYHFTVNDDGKGIPLDAIVAKARKKMKTSPYLREKIKTLLDENRLIELMFLEGFSTREKITKISGRGVGLDIVYKAVCEGGGTIAVETKLNKGSRFTLSFPRMDLLS